MDFDEIRRLRSVDARIAAAAAPNGGAVSDWQLRRVDVSAAVVRLRTEDGSMRPVSPSEYVVGPAAYAPIDDRIRRGIAIVRAGPIPCALCRGTASAQHGFLDRGDGSVHVAIPASQHVIDLPQLRIVYHRSEWLNKDTIRYVDGEPTTDATRTLLDLGHDHTPYQIARAMCQARDDERLDMPTIEAWLRDHPRTPGTRSVRAAVRLVEGGCNGTRGRCEDLLVTGVARSSILPEPHVCNRRRLGVAGIEPDLYFDDVGIVVFADGAPHRWLDVQVRDRMETATLRQAGLLVLRFPNRRIWRDLRGVVAEIERAYVSRRRRWIHVPGECAIALV